MGEHQSIWKTDRRLSEVEHLLHHPLPGPFDRAHITLAIHHVDIFLHTYLVGATAIKKAVRYDLSPALHIAVARIIELASATSPAEFLLAFIRITSTSFINVVAIRETVKKDIIASRSLAKISVPLRSRSFSIN